MGGTWHYLALLLTFLCISEGARYHDQFDKSMEAFLIDNGYTGGAIAALKDGHIIYAKGYGVNNEGHEVKDTSLFPVSSISKSITAIAILQLAEIGALDLDGKVFGHSGYLHMLKPMLPESVDPRLHDITVRHLLHHSGGWDLNKGPLYDPLLNAFYLKKGSDVPDIGKAMETQQSLSYYDIIRYVMSQRLDFTPGTKSVYSNLGYTMLGRIIEELGDTTYEDFIKQNILKPCGMWHTRIGSRQKIEQLARMKQATDEVEFGDVSIFDVLHPSIIDSTLGWYSNVFDMIRFARCIEHHAGTGLLKKHSVEELTRKPEAAPVQHSSNWFGAGFRTNNLGSFWQDSDKHSDDALLFHTHKHKHETNMPDAWVFLLHGTKLKHLKHKAHELMEYLGVQFDGDEIPLHDLSDIQIPHTAVKYAVGEHHLSAYIHALKLEQYDITWVAGYEAVRNTKFAVVAQKSKTPQDYLVEYGFTEKKLYSRKLELEDEGYNMTFLQNYKSYSHDDEHVFLAIFRKSAFDKLTHMKWGIHHYPRPYDKLLELYMEKGYYPTCQSYIHDEDEALISFMFMRRDNQRKVNFKEYHGLSIPALERAVRINANRNRKLAYMDVSIVYKKPRFSAVFTNQDPSLWEFVAELTSEEATKLIIEKFELGYYPMKIVGYARTDRVVKYAMYLEKLNIPL